MLCRLITLLAMFAAVILSPRATAQTISNPAQLWWGYDPATEPLEIEVVKRWQEDGCAFETLRFIGEVANGVRTRVFAMQGAPMGKTRLPGILHIHGGGQTYSAEWVKFWTRRGYVCVSFDFCGPWQQRTEFTDWGPIAHANMAQAAGGLQVHPTPRESSWFHWAKAARRALTLLANHPSVDPQRLGIFGISVGGNLTSMVAGSDRRVKCAVAIYGSGYNYDRRKAALGFPEQTPDLALFQQTLSPEAHAPYVTCPFLHLDATNDFHAWLDYSDELLGAMKGETRQAFTPHYNHHTEPEQGADLALWMDRYLRQGKPFPASPRVAVRLNGQGIPIGRLTVKEATQVRRVDFYYALGDRIPPARFWRAVVAERRGNEWRALLPVMDTWSDLHFFANVLYNSGALLSSNLEHVIPAHIGPAEASLEWKATLDQWSDHLKHWYFTAGYTDPNISKPYLRIEDGGPADQYLTLVPDLFGDPMQFSISSHIVGDPQFEGRPGMALAFDTKGAYVEGLTVSAVQDDWGPRARIFSATVDPSQLGKDWRSVKLPISKFVDSEGHSLTAWRGVNKLEIKGKAGKSGPPCFARFQWVVE